MVKYVKNKRGVFMWAIVLGALTGSGAVFLFNRVPKSWLADYGEKGPEGGAGKRAAWFPMGAAGSVFLTLSFFFLFQRDDRSGFHLAASILLLLLFWLMAAADWKYGILPDQFTVLCFSQALLLNYPHFNWSGAALLGGTSFLLGFFSERITGNSWIGFGDIKLLFVLGFLFGIKQGMGMFCLAAILSGTVMGILLAAGKLTLKSSAPFGPYLAFAASVTLVFF